MEDLENKDSELTTQTTTPTQKRAARKAGKKAEPKAVTELTDAAREAAIDKLRDLQIAEATDRASQRVMSAEQKRARTASFQEELKDTNAAKHRTANGCTHKKGGRVTGTGGLHNALYSGNNADYAIVVHTLPIGGQIVVCQRCPKVWEKPKPELKLTNPTAYEQQLREFEWALKLPTDNEPSGTQLFLIQRAA